MIRQAKTLIYIETQVLRSRAIGRALTRAARRNPDLCVVVLLPTAPEEVAFSGNTSSVHRYGDWLQARSIDRLRRAFGNRIGIYSLTNSMQRVPKHERDAIDNRSAVYVHSKLMIVDDAVAMISSANLNARSMSWDFEAGAKITDRDFAFDLRQRLWSAHLGIGRALVPDLSDPARALAIWQEAAQNWAGSPGDGQPCGVIDYPHEKAKLFAKRHLFIPEAMV